MFNSQKHYSRLQVSITATLPYLFHSYCSHTNFPLVFQGFHLTLYICTLYCKVGSLNANIDAINFDALVEKVGFHNAISHGRNIIA